MVGKPTLGRFTLFLVLVGVFAILAGAGFYAGRYTVLAPFRAKMNVVRQVKSFSHFLSEASRDGAERAYFDAEAAKAGLDSYSWTVPNVLTPFVGHGPEPGQTGNADINLWQCRSSASIQSPKPTDVVRIFATGASVLFSCGASAEERTIGGALQAMLNKELSAATGKRYEVFVLANPAWTSAHERILIENRIVELEPDAVVSVSGTSDMIWGRSAENAMWFRSFPDKAYFQVLNELLVAAGDEPMFDVAPVGVEVPTDLVVARIERNVRLATFVLGLQDVPYLFFLQPLPQLSAKELSPREQGIMQAARHTPAYREFRRLVRERLREVDGCHYGDLTPLFDELKATDEIFLDAFHVGDRGNALIAAEIFRALRPLLSP